MATVRGADLVLLEVDPLEDLGTLRQPTGVVKRGRWLGAKELARLLAAARRN